MISAEFLNNIIESMYRKLGRNRARRFRNQEIEVLTNQTKNNSPKIYCGTEEVHKNAPETMLGRLKEIFIASFLSAYNGLDPQNDLGLAPGDSTEQFLNSACTATLNNWRNSESQKLYAAINQATQVIEGFIVLDRSNPEQVYIAQMAIAPDTQGRGLGKKLVALADNFSPEGSLQFRNATPSIELAFYPALIS